MKLAQNFVSLAKGEIQGFNSEQQAHDDPDSTAMHSFLNSKYDSITLIGIEGYGVYSAIDKNTRLPKTLKITPMTNVVLLQEYMRLQWMPHPNIVSIHPTFAPGVSSRVCLELESMKNNLKSSFLDSLVKLPENLLKSITLQICSALLYLQQHQFNKLIYGSVHPSNILVREYNLQNETIQVALCVEKNLKTSSSSDAIASQIYCAPELKLKAVSSVESDMFSLGAQLVQFMAIHTSCLGMFDSIGESISEYITNSELKDLGGGYSREFIDLVTKMVHEQPTERISPQEVITILSRPNIEQDSRMSNMYIEQDSRLANISFAGNIVTTYNDGIVTSNSISLKTNVSVIEEIIPAQYSHIEHISKGGFGVVYKAFNLQKQKELAVKVIHIQDSSSFNLAFQEALNMTKLTHPNIVPMYHAFTPGNTSAICIEMELMKGSLYSLFIAKKVMLSEKMLQQIAKQVCEALSWITEKQLLHRDIKPGNILVKDFNLEQETIQVALCDFGLAKSMNDLTHNTVPGTQAFLAPELLDKTYAENGRLFSPASDIFALGVTFYQLMTLDSETFVGVKSMIEKDVTQFLKTALIEHNSQWQMYSARFTQLVASMLQAHPSKRITSQDAIEMLSRLESTRPSESCCQIC
ncbi:hypothetical protein C9374_006435 [Naegleria lovaniensis]|uniref:non-specific serine/threonine protein kinase n=1 Tax=Naegleria lovaniensis TaxID=51637 RepID=A0AA88GLQ6_NAELO|nr:uncharacterized protein C9374_006435 [Naegleria lovaniensis]KAG2381446.1 hypothetical protein C9374_006435 [Naegleria lovaniensis]